MAPPAAGLIANFSSYDLSGKPGDTSGDRYYKIVETIQPAVIALKNRDAAPEIQ